MNSTSESYPDESPLLQEHEDFDTDQTVIQSVFQPISSSSQTSSKGANGEFGKNRTLSLKAAS
jgi:hypothetical protein